MTRTILITGTSSGFGRVTAERLARDGYRVFAAMRDITGRNRSHADALRSQKIGVVELDVTDDRSVDRAIASILAEAGKIDVLVNNAGIASVGVTEAFTSDQAKSIFDTNVIGFLRVTRAVLPSMRREHDRSEEHTSELQSHVNLVCRLLLEKKKKKKLNIIFLKNKNKKIKKKTN